MRNDGNNSSNLSMKNALKGVTPHLLAVAMIQAVSEDDKPWRMTDVMATSEVNDKLPMVCEFYQLRIFLDLLTQRFGAVLCSLVEASLISVLDVRDKYPGMDIFTKVTAAILRAREFGAIGDVPGNYEIGMDYQVADQALKIVSEPDEVKRLFRPALAASLTYARIWAEKAFPAIVAQIDFDPPSVAFLNIETSYKGLTNRWREYPGCFERHLQRMEGNPLFKESQQHPTDEDIIRARAKDAADLNQLEHDVDTLFADIKKMGSGNVQLNILIDMMQHRIQPLMIRAAAVGQLTSAQRHLKSLKDVMESVFESLSLSSEDRAGLRKSWEQQLNSFCAQKSRDDTPIESSDYVLSLLCENVDEVEAVLEIYQKLDPRLTAPTRERALLYFRKAELEGFRLPGAKEKLAIFGKYS
jgi:hypothetical protein